MSNRSTKLKLFFSIFFEYLVNIKLLYYLELYRFREGPPFNSLVCIMHIIVDFNMYICCTDKFCLFCPLAYLFLWLTLRTKRLNSHPIGIGCNGRALSHDKAIVFFVPFIFLPRQKYEKVKIRPKNLLHFSSQIYHALISNRLQARY